MAVHSHLAMLFFSHMYHHLRMTDTPGGHDHNMVCMQKSCKGALARCEAADGHIESIDWQLSHLDMRQSCCPAYPGILFLPT